MGVRLTVVAAFLAASVACGGTPPAAPFAPPKGSAPPAGSAETIVRLVDAVSGDPVAGVSGTINFQPSLPSDAAGQSSVWAQQSGQYTVKFTGSFVLSRTTSIKVPAAETRVSLIPSSFDLGAFNQMFRSGGGLTRWMSAPPLVILTRAVQFEAANSDTLTVLPDELTAAELDALEKDLTDGFVLLTDRQFPGFAQVTRESPEVGSRVNVMRTGCILVARAKGLTEGTRAVSPPGGYAGYGRWALYTSGAVAGGNVMIDADFDRAASPYRRTLRMHELGHALGYNHVLATTRASVMNQGASLEPNEWDRQAVHIAFQRMPGSSTPDNDPTGYSLNLRTGAVTWSPPIY